MSYHLRLISPTDKNDFDFFSITYNYSRHLYRVFGKKGIRSIYGKTGIKSIPIIKRAISKLKDDFIEHDYWAPTEGNTKHALYKLSAMSGKRPDWIWEGD